MTNESPVFPRPLLSVVGFVFLVIFLFLSLFWDPFPWQSFLWSAIRDFGHVVLFALLAFLLVYISRNAFNHRLSTHGKCYALAGGGILVLAVVSEILQVSSGIRTPSVEDVIRDLIGGGCGLAWFATVDRKGTGWSRWQQGHLKKLVRLGVLLVFLAALTPVMVWGNAYRQRNRQLPVLCQFSSSWEMMFVIAKGSDLQVMTPPPGWVKSPGETVGRIVFHPVRFPRIILFPDPDWRGYSYFAVDIFSELSEERRITLKIYDQQHKQQHDSQYTDRFNTSITVAPGLNRIKIPLDDIRRAPAGREMDLATIHSVSFFASSPPESFVLYFDNIRLGAAEELSGYLSGLPRDASLRAPAAGSRSRGSRPLSSPLAASLVCDQDHTF